MDDLSFLDKALPKTKEPPKEDLSFLDTALPKNDLSFLDQALPTANTSANNILAKMRGSIMTQESGGRLGVQNDRTSATGLFQVMPANIPTWTKKYYKKSLTPSEFAKDRNAQEAVFQGEMGKYVNRALQLAQGDEDKAIRMASAAWYGGEGAMHRYDNVKRFRLNEPSFREYTTSVLNRIKKGGEPSLAPQANPLVEQGVIDPTVYTPEAQQPTSPIDERQWDVEADGTAVAPQIAPPDIPHEAPHIPTELKDREALQPVDTTAIDAMMRAPQRGAQSKQKIAPKTQKPAVPTKAESDEPVILDDDVTVQRVTEKDADNAIADTFDVNGMSIDDATKKVRSELSAKYDKDFSKLVLTDTQGNPLIDTAQLKKPIALTYGKLKTYGVGTEPLVTQRVAETRIEAPEPNLDVKSDFSAEDAESLNNTFGTTIGSAIASTLNAGGNTANALAGLLKVIQDLNPAKLDSMAEASKLKPYRAGEDVVKYLQGVGASTGALTAKTGDKYYEPATADDKGYLEGRPVEKETWVTTGGKAVGALADMPRIALMPGGLAAPMLSFATDAMLQAASQGEEVDWSKVKQAGTHGAVLGGIAQVAPFVGKAGNTAISTLLNKASSNVLKEGITLGTIGGGTYVASREMGASRDAAFREAVLFSAMHGFGVLKKMVGEPIRVKDTNGNEAVIKISEDGKVETLDPKTEAKAQMVIPKEVETKIQEYLKKDAEIQAEAAKTVDAVSTENVSPKAKNIDTKQSSVDSVNIPWKPVDKSVEIADLKQKRDDAIADIQNKIDDLALDPKAKPEINKLKAEIVATTKEYNDQIRQANKAVVDKQIDQTVADTTLTPEKAAEDILKTYESTNTPNTNVEPTKTTEVKPDSNVRSEGKTEPKVDEIRPQGTGTADSVQPTEGTKPSKIGVSIERKAIEKGLTDTFEGTAGFEKTSVEAQAKMIADVLTNPERVQRIIEGKEAVPNGLRQSYFIKGVEDNALATGDVATLKALAKSKLTSDTSTFAQEMRMMGERSQDSVTARINELRAERREAFKNKGHDVRVLDTRIKELEAKLAERESDVAKMQTRSELSKATVEQNITRPLIDRAERYAERLRKEADVARERLKKRGNVFQSGIDPIAMKELAKIGASHIADLGLDFAKFSDKMIGEFGKKIKPHLKDLYEKAQEIATKFDRRALKMIESRLATQIANLERQIETKTRDVVAREPIPLSEKGKELQAKRDALRKELNEVVPRVKRGISDEKYNAQRVKALNKQIAALDAEIKSGIKQTKEKMVRKLSPEVEKLAQKRDELKTQHTEVFGKPEMSDAKRLQLVKQRSENTIAILKGEAEAPPKRPPVTLDAQAENLKAQINLLRSKVDVSDVEIETLAGLTKTLADTRQAMQGNRRAENATSGTPEELAYGRAEKDLHDYLNDLKHDAKATKWEDVKARPLKATARWAAATVVNAPGVMKSMKATLDDSALFRQGWKTLFTNPIIWKRNALKSFSNIARTLRGKEVEKEIFADIVSRPTYDLMKKAGLDVGVREEAFPSQLPEKIPGFRRLYKASETAYMGFLHKTRADIFDKMIRIAKDQEVKLTDTELTNIGRMVNSLTGRGYLGKLELAADPINTIFFSPRMLKGQIDTLLQPMLGGTSVRELTKGENYGSKFVRKQAAYNLFKSTAGTAAVIAIAKMIAPGSVTLDPRSSDFGKVKVGNTRFDVTGGLGSILTLMSRLITSQSVSTATGAVSDLQNPKFGGKSHWDIIEDFFENKLSPMMGIVRDFAKGKNFEGEKPTLIGAGLDSITPLPIHTFVELLKDPKAQKDPRFIVFAQAMDMLGISTNTYSGTRPPKNKTDMDDTIKFLTESYDWLLQNPPKDPNKK